MSGHSKWHNIQGRKGKQDAKRSNLFSKFAKKITVAAKTGGGDAEANFSLRLAIEKAKDVGMPKDNIERAIKLGSGDSKDVAIVEELLYEAYGPGGAAIIIKILTDSKNRTAAEIKHLLSKQGGTFGASGSVQWMFQHLGVVRIKKGKISTNRDEFELLMIESGAEDIAEDEELLEIKTKVENLQKIINKLKELNIETESAAPEWVAKEKVKVSTEIVEKLQNLFGELEEHDDVEDYYTNAE
jgi:YebC/PmpR family DNA-binding regulatory protein